MSILYRISVFTFLIIFLTSCFDYEEVQFKGMQGFNIEERTEDNITVRLDIKVDNPNTYNIKIKKSNLDLYLNKKYLGKAKIKKSVTLKKKQIDTYPVYIKTSGKDLMKSAMGNIGSLLSGKVNLGVKGDLKASVYGISKKFPVEMEEDVSLKGMF